MFISIKIRFLNFFHLVLLCKGLLSNYYVNSSRMENAVNTFSIRSTQNYFSLLNLDSVLVRCISHLFYKISPIFFKNLITLLVLKYTITFTIGSTMQQDYFLLVCWRSKYTVIKVINKYKYPAGEFKIWRRYNYQ